MSIDIEKEKMRAELLGSLIEFTKTFFEVVTGRKFIISHPIGRESHFITIARALTQAARLEITDNRLIINCPPGHGKSVMLSMWVAWTMASNPDSNFLYISYSKTIAAKHTEFIKRVMTSKHYTYLFDVEIRQDSRAKDSFRTTAGGSVGAYGSTGSITGQDGGLPGLDRFTGAIIIDDAHKPDEATSETIRQGVIDNYSETIQQRARGEKVPTIFIGQRVHEADLAAHLLEGNDGYKWESVILESIDIAGNALYPEAFPLEMLHKREKTDPYVFSSQFQQNPIPAGGAIFKPDWFPLIDEEPECLCTFITADTAETNKSWNDATVFSFFGLYEIESMGRKTGQVGIHWLDCAEIRIEPKDLKNAFLDFYGDCMRHPVPPKVACIEKKSTGVTLVSVLSDLRGISVRPIERTRASGSKTQRFLEMQPFIASKQVSFTAGARHTDMCVSHMCKITANDAHRHDDIADTLSDAVRLALIDKSLYTIDTNDDKRNSILSAMSSKLNKKLQVGAARHGRSS